MSSQQESQNTQPTATDRRFILYRRILIFLTLFVGIGALGGGGLALLFPDGSLMAAQELIVALQKAPLVGQFIDSLTLPGSALLLFIFAPQIVAAFCLLAKRPRQFTACLICGILLTLFTLVELVLIPNLLSVLYLAFGLTEVGLALACMRSSNGSL